MTEEEFIDWLEHGHNSIDAVLRTSKTIQSYPLDVECENGSTERIEVVDRRHFDLLLTTTEFLAATKPEVS